jgi:hypothetical protein
MEEEGAEWWRALRWRRALRRWTLWRALGWRVLRRRVLWREPCGRALGVAAPRVWKARPKCGIRSVFYWRCFAGASSSYDGRSAGGPGAGQGSLRVGAEQRNQPGCDELLGGRRLSGIHQPRRQALAELFGKLVPISVVGDACCDPQKNPAWLPHDELASKNGS